MKVIVRFEDVPNGRIPKVGMNNLMILEGKCVKKATLQRRINRLIHTWHKNRVGKMYEVTDFNTGRLWFMGQVT